MSLPTAPGRRAPRASFHAPRRDHRGSLGLAARPRLSQGRGRGRARLSEGRERLFRGGVGAAQALVDTLFEEMKGRIKEDCSSVPLADGPYEYWWAFQPGAQYRQWFRRKLAGGERATDLRRGRRGRGQGLFPPRRDRRQPRPQAARDPGRRRRVGAVQAEHPRPRHRQRHRDGHRRRHRPAGVDQRQPGPRLHRGQRPLAQRQGASCTASATTRPKRSTLYEETEDKGFSVGVDRSQDRQPDLHRDRRQYARAKCASSPPTTRPPSRC